MFKSGSYDVNVSTVPGEFVTIQQVKYDLESERHLLNLPSIYSRGGIQHSSMTFSCMYRRLYVDYLNRYLYKNIRVVGQF